MLKKILLIGTAALILLGLAGCKPDKLLHCDHCGAEVTVEADSNMEEHWIIYCPKCNEELFGDNPVVQDGRPNE